MFRKRIVRIAALIPLAFATAGAQRVDRAVRPAVPPARPFSFPPVVTRTLSNGLRVAVVENHALPLVAVRVVMPVDSAADPAGREGLYALTLGMMREGTTTLSAEQMATVIGEMGSDVTPLRFTTVTRNVGKSLELMAGMLMHPSLPEEAIERRKATQVAAIQRNLQTPSQLPRRIFYSLVYGESHPAARAITASEASVKSITRADVAAFHAEYFRPENVTLVISGDLAPDDAMRLAERYFASWKRGGEPYRGAEQPLPSPQQTTIYLVDRPNVTQSYVVAGHAGPPRESPDYYALEMMGPILGAGSASRMSLNLRERHSWLYSGALSAPVWRPTGQRSLIFGSAALAQPKTDSALVEWMHELAAIGGERPPTPDEMNLARAALTTSLPAQIETIDRVADRVATLARNGMPFDYDARLAGAIGPLTSADVSAAARRHLDTGHMVIVVAGDRKVLEPMLRAAKIAPVVVVDANGRPAP